MSYSLRHTFVTSDHHFGSWKNGPFVAFTQEQENELIEKWNNVIKPNDIVLYNGDFCDCDVLNLIQYVKKLNGQIILIKGNHDILPLNVYNSIFKDVEDEMFLPELNLVINHIPVETSYNQVYGHLHRGEIVGPLDKAHNFCSCVQANDGYPISLEHILLSFK